MIVGIFLIIYVFIFSIICPIALHYFYWETFNIFHILLSFFLGLNFLISLWEIGLGLHISHINKEYKHLSAKYKGNEFSAVIDFFNTPVNHSLKFWSKVWSTYSLYDPSYSNRESFGFFVDVGNGWSTCIPSLFAMVAMSVDIFGISARTVGVICILKYYQEFYGTIIYFLSFVLNGRYHGKSISEVLLFVGFTNGLWFFFPLLGIYSSYILIDSNSFDIFRK